MKRKEFIFKSCQCGIATIAGLIFVSKKSFSQSGNYEQNELDIVNDKLHFSQQRFSDFIQHLDKFLDEETRQTLYRKVGESCAYSSYKDVINDLKGNLKLVLDELLKQDWLKEYDLDEEKGELKLIGKPKSDCGCALVKKGLTPVEFCNCSIGHMTKFYEMITDKNVEVKLDSSVLMGNEQCSFTVFMS